MHGAVHTGNARLRKNSLPTLGIITWRIILEAMSRRTIGMLLIASLIAIGSIIAGCTDIQGATSADLAPPTGQEPPDDPGSVAAGNNRFAFDLYRELAGAPGAENIFFSPYSISSALAITYEGARGATADEIHRVLHLPVSDTRRREGFFRIDAGLNNGDENYTLRTANALWAEKAYPFLPEYIDIAERWYGANTTNLDFAKNPEGSRATINRWVEEKTEEKIRDLLPVGSISPATRLVITNAIYFKGTWSMQFDANKTKDEEFRTGQNRTVTVPMMQRTDEDAKYRYAETATLQALEMPYAHGNGTELSMLVLLPKEGNLTAAEKVLNVEEIAALQDSMARKRVKVFFPKFGLDTEYFLSKPLAAMGMPTAFSPGADFSGMDGTKNLLISDVVHKAFVDVNEEGTEAAAATGVIMNVSAAPPGGDIPVFRADHPFIFFITEKDSGTILFAGRVINP